MDKYTKKLPVDINEQVKLLNRKGSDFQMEHKNLKAVESFKKGLELVPEPKDQWVYTSVLLANIAENYFLQAHFRSKSKEESEKHYRHSLDYFTEFMKNTTQIGHAINHRRIGQIYYELGDFENAKEELLRAYADGGKECFKNLDPKYYELIKPVVENKDNPVEL